MSNGIAQFNMQYDAVEDRIQLRVLSTNDEEIRLWLTRRYVRLLLTALAEKFNLPLPSAVPPQQPRYTPAQHAATAMGNESHGNVAPTEGPSERFSDPYLGTDETHLPMGETPVLVSRIALKDKDDGHIGLLLGQEHEGGMQVELSLNSELVESLQAMLLEAAHTAEWDIAESPPVEDFTEHLSGVVLH